MKVEILCVPSYPNCHSAVELVREALRKEGLSAKIREVIIRDQATAEALHFPGSPTVRLNGHDVEPVEATPALCCRLYRDAQGKTVGVAPLEAIRRLLRERARE